MSLAGCAKDKPETHENPENPTIAEGAGTMNVSLKYASQTRANDYENGTASESKAKDLTIYFFDKDSRYLGLGEAPKLNQEEQDGGNVERTVIAVDVPAGVVSGFYAADDDPGKMTKAYVVAVLNKGDFAPVLTSVEEAEKQGGTASTYADFNDMIDDMGIEAVTEDGNFLMTSSNYVVDDVEQALLGITKEHVGIRSTSLSKEPMPVVIAVERVAAKVQVVKKADVNVDILGWGLNVTNKKFYPVKKFTNGFLDVLTTKYAGWGQNTAWSNSDDKRSYWAVDPNYTEGIVAEDGTSGDFGLLDYNSLIDLEETAYCFENTFSEEMQNRNSTTSAIIVAKFNPAGTGSGTWVNWKQQNFSERDFVNTVVGDADGKEQNIAKYYYRVENPEAGTVVDDGYKVGEYLYCPLGTDEFQFSYNGTEDIKFGDVVIGKKGANASVELTKDFGAFYTAPADTDDNDAWEANEVKGAKEAIAAAITAAIDARNNPVTVYVGGYSYYEVPLRHFNDSEVAPYAGGEYEPEHLGRYGIVRNNYYKLTINAITTPGKPISDKPIPTKDRDDVEEYYIDTEIQVLSWNVRNQVVEL